METRTGMTKVFILALILIGLLIAAGCTSRDVQNKTEVIELEGAERVSAEVTMLAGQLNITGGADQLMNADFLYSVEDWEPEVAYKVENNLGLLEVRQPGNPEIAIRDTYYEWNLSFSNDVPIDLSVRLGAGENNLNLSGMMLSNLDVEMGAGESVIDLTGDWEEDMNVLLRGGVGEGTIRLPQDVGVRVDIDGGIGDINASGLSMQDDVYINDAFGESDVTLDILIEAGIGQINLEVGP